MSEILIHHNANCTTLLDYNTRIEPYETRKLSSKWLDHHYFKTLLDIGEIVILEQSEPLPNVDIEPEHVESDIVNLRQKCIDAGFDFDPSWDCERLLQELTDAGDA